MSTCPRSLAFAALAVAVVLGAARAAEAAPAAEDDPNLTAPVQITWDQKIPMRDGVKLSATIYRDPRQTQRLPVILTMTPYIAADAAHQGSYFAHNGYVFVSVDLRGRGNSDGVFVPAQVEAKDGYDTVEWLARQPWCDGQVAMWGGSWRGFTQWSIAKELPPHLTAIAPTASVHPGVDFPARNGFVYPYALRWLTLVHGRALNEGLFEEGTIWANAERQQVTSRRAFQDLDEITGARGTVFRTWLAHPREDAFWQAATPRAQDYAKLRLPILTITGHYDGDQAGALAYYERHMANGRKEVTARHWLVIGPWGHAETRHPTAEIGGLSFGPDAVMSMEALHKAWYDHVLKAAPAPAFLKDRVACFVSGRNQWIYASELKQIEGAPLSLALDLAGAGAGDVTRSGSLAGPPPSAAAQVTLTADPMYLPPRDDHGADDQLYLRSQRRAYAALPSQVILHTAPFAAETVLSGRARLRLQLAVDQPDADLQVELYEIAADGSAALLADSEVRLRYRKGGTAPVLMTPGKPELIEVPRFGFFARAIAKGSRLRLVIDAGPRLGAQRNTHTGGDLASEPLSRARVAKLTLMTGPASGSLLELPQPEPALLKAR